MTETGYARSSSDWAANQAELYENSNGAEGTLLRGVPCVVLTTIGRKTGAVRKSPLMRVNDGDRYAVIASLGGAPKHPVWYLNLLADPVVKLRDRDQVRTYRAHVAEGAERAEWWDKAVAVWPDYAGYQEKTERVIPVVVLVPTD
ncbi:nitroreductase family deazaflavin-dependent oxidoreductase [Nakamurella sp. YIM 132087]|uniref:Nitroreductase family deazaflavin-dependent oxidoreductase n=1 Tax=Nakamurella alba TaxID=2665158 RepID=A0A7K1FPG6_9ACTN|nr:nitroreductase family deazaflavin-dependent oxidoreductase [Nakamurella alba]MTD16036.1 nitroreductase family deazaflavin-dependent oxidoreductase [Nakamurella alba]